VARLSISRVRLLDLLELWLQFGHPVSLTPRARSKERFGGCLPRLVEQHSDHGAADTDRPAGVRIDAT
jgi:hypothetical protein